jgi:shikimate kinase
MPRIRRDPDAESVGKANRRLHIRGVNDAPRSIVLIGFMGSGKSSVGRLLARRCDWPCFETDEMVAVALGRSISEIFAQLGEAEFRKAETKVLQELDTAKGAIIVTGGGVVLLPENIRRLRELGPVVWLTADLDTLQGRLEQRKNRPLLQTPNPAETIAALLEQRKKFYEEAGDLVVDTSRLSPKEVAQAICDGLQVSC